MSPVIATCPFCDAPWSAEMLAQYDAATGPSGCACCFGRFGAHTPAQAPSEDLRCTTCGRAIYRVVSTPRFSAS